MLKKRAQSEIHAAVCMVMDYALEQVPASYEDSAYREYLIRYANSVSHILESKKFSDQSK